MAQPNARATVAAAAALRREVATTKLGPGEVPALVYVSDYREANGVQVPGFRPGYSVRSWRSDHMTNWKAVRLPDGLELRFFPLFASNDGDEVIVDLIESALVVFSIQGKSA